MVQIRLLSSFLTLSTGNDHELFFKALDESGNDRNHGRDYFEIDLAGEWCISRPLTRDFGDGTYLFILQVHPDFTGTYNFTVVLLFRNYLGLFLTLL